MENSETNIILKHIDVRYHFNRNIILTKRINLKYLSTEKMLADILTKDSNNTKILKFTNNMFYIKILFERE